MDEYKSDELVSLIAFFMQFNLKTYCHFDEQREGERARVRRNLVRLAKPIRTAALRGVQDFSFAPALNPTLALSK